MNTIEMCSKNSVAWTLFRNHIQYNLNEILYHKLNGDNIHLILLRYLKIYIEGYK